MICCKCHKEITKTYGRVTDLGNYCKECAKQNEVEVAKLFESNMKSVLEIEKNNAIKEFAEKLKEKFGEYEVWHYNGDEEGWHDLKQEIDECVKEFTE